MDSPIHSNDGASDSDRGEIEGSEKNNESYVEKDTADDVDKESHSSEPTKRVIIPPYLRPSHNLPTSLTTKKNNTNKKKQ